MASRLPSKFLGRLFGLERDVNLRNLRQCPAGGFLFLGRLLATPRRLPHHRQVLGKKKFYGRKPVLKPACTCCLEAETMVPVERIELPTFGLQNRAVFNQINILAKPCCNRAASVT